MMGIHPVCWILKRFWYRSWNNFTLLQKLETNQNGNWKKSRQIITIRLCQKFIQIFAMTRIFEESQAFLNSGHNGVILLTTLISRKDDDDDDIDEEANLILIVMAMADVTNPTFGWCTDGEDENLPAWCGRVHQAMVCLSFGGTRYHVVAVL